MDEGNNPLPFVNVYIKYTSLGTITDEKGNYYIQLREGNYEVVFSVIGYTTKSHQIIIDKKDVVQNTYLSSSIVDLNELVIKAKKRDPAYEIIQSAIQNREKNNSIVHSYKVDTYIKASEIISEKEKRKRAKLRAQKKIEKQREKEDYEPISPEKLHQIEQVKLAYSLNMVEIQSEKSFKYPDKVKEIRNGYKKTGSAEGLFFLTTSQDDFNFYQNLLHLDNLNQVPITSPLNTSSILSYKFRLEDTYFEDDKMIYHIKITSRKQGNSTFNGYIDIYENSFAIRKIEMNLNKGGLLYYDKFQFTQEYQIYNDTINIVAAQSFNYFSKAGKSNFKGETIVAYTNYKFDVQFPKRFFKNELTITTQEAYDKDSTYWSETRPKPLTIEEQKIIYIKDSIKAAHNTKQYLDSVDNEYNKITAADVLWYGIGKFNRDKGTHIRFSGMAEFLSPFDIGGLRAGPSLFFIKKWKNEKYLLLYSGVNVGLRNNDWKGNFYSRYLYDPIKRSNIYFSTGKIFDMVQTTEAITSSFDRSNWVEKTYLEIGHSQEYLNGLFFNFFISQTNINPIDSYQFGTFTEKAVENNIPRSFTAYQNFKIDFSLSFTPFQQYVTEPYKKVILGSKWPTFNVNYKKGFPTIFSSDVNFDFLQTSVTQKIKIGTIGSSTYKLGAGKFLRTNSLPYEEAKVFPRGDSWFFGSPFENQLQDSTIISNGVFFEAHLVHHFNGAIVNYIPVIKKLRLYTLVGANYTYIKETNYHYADFYAGIERVFRIQRQRFRIGIYGVYGGSNTQLSRPTIQFSIQQYDNREKSWGN